MARKTTGDTGALRAMVALGVVMLLMMASQSSGDDAISSCLRTFDQEPEISCDVAMTRAQSDAWPRTCLTTRVPWRTRLRAVSCCFAPCLVAWQDALGLSAVQRHWQDVAATRSQGSRLQRRVLSWPNGSDVLMSHANIERFSLVIEDPDDASEHDAFLKQPATTSAASGWIVAPRIPARQPDSNKRAHAFRDRWGAAFSASPVSLISMSDTSIVKASAPAAKAWAPAQRGGRIFETNPDLRGGSHPFPSFPRYHTTQSHVTGVEDSVLAMGSPRARLLACCCMRLSPSRVARLAAPGGAAAADACPAVAAVERMARSFAAAGPSEACPSGFCVPKHEYAQRLLSSEFVWTPSGIGWGEAKYFEALHAGAVPIVDAFDSARFTSPGHVLFQDMPVLFVHLHACATNDTAAFRWHSQWWCANTSLEDVFRPQALQAALRALQQKQARLDMSKLYYPFWLYQLTQSMKPTMQSSRTPDESLAKTAALSEAMLPARLVALVLRGDTFRDGGRGTAGCVDNVRSIANQQKVLQSIDEFIVEPLERDHYQVHVSARPRTLTLPWGYEP